MYCDMGCRSGSFDASAFPFTTVRLDLEAGGSSNFVRADAAALPFGDDSFDAVISNHSLEHLSKLDRARISCTYRKSLAARVSLGQGCRRLQDHGDIVGIKALPTDLLERQDHGVAFGQ